MHEMRKTFGLFIGTILAFGFAFLLAQAEAPAVQASEAAVTRLAWLGGCYPPARAVGRYFPGDVECRPSQTIALETLRAELGARGVLQPGDTLQYAPALRPRALTCWGLVLRGGQAAGWVCSDASGTYRVDMNGRLVSGRWLLLSDGAWVEASGR